MFRKIGEFATRFPGLIVATAVALMVLAGTYGTTVFGHLDNRGFTSKNAESTKVFSALGDEFRTSSTSVVVIFDSRDARLATDPSYKADVEAALKPVEGHQYVTSLKDYYTTKAPSFISKNKRSTYAAIVLSGSLKEQESRAADLIRQIKSDHLKFSFGGVALINHDIDKQISADLSKAETVSFIALGILLVVVFRSLIASLLPLLLGAFAILCSFLALKLLSEVTVVSQYATNVIILIGLGLSVDYSLLIVSRFREEMANAKGDTRAALHETMHTAGHTVFFSGLAVIISLLSLIVFPLDFLRSMGEGGAAAVAVAMLAALVVLPAILTLIGSWVDVLSFGSVRRLRSATMLGIEHTEGRSVWVRVGAFFMRWPAVTVILTLALLLFAGSPFLHVKLSSPDQHALPSSAQSRQVADRLESDFHVTNTPVVVLYQAPHLLDPAQVGKLYDYVAALQKVKGARAVSSIVTLPTSQLQTRADYQLAFGSMAKDSQLAESTAPILHGDTTLITINFDYPSISSDAQHLVQAIRDVPRPVGTTINAGGSTAELVDQLSVLAKYLPYALVIIAVALVLLLFFMLGSVVLPVVAMFQNALSMSVSFGALVWVFQDGHLAGWFGFDKVGSIYATNPVLVFAIAFGMSMDYSVFLYGRIKEQYDVHHDTRRAIMEGLQKTGGIITSAAMLLFVVVAAFATSKISIMQEIGLGLALAILVDAFIVRMVLVPASMKLLGRANWWAPKPLRWLHAKLGLENR